MGKIEDKIMNILSRPLEEEVSYEVIGGPTPSDTLKSPLDYAKNVQQAKVPTAPGSSDGALDIPGVGEIGDDDASDNDPITDVIDDMDEEEDKDGDDDEDIDETFSALLARLAEEEDDDEDDDDELDEDETSLKGDNGGTPSETLIGDEIDNLNDTPDKLVTQAPGAAVAESEDDEDDDDDDELDESEDDDDDDEDDELDEDETSLKGDNGGKEDETLPDVDSKLDSPDKLVTKAPGASVAEDIRAIFAGTKLSEKVQTKAAKIFKAAVTRQVNEEKARVQVIATQKLKEAYAVLKARTEKKAQIAESKLTVQVDTYLNYVVENWMKENRLAVERGIRAELAEDFIKGLKNLFVEHYIEVPESKVDVVATLGKKVTKLESKLNEQVETNIKMRSSLSGYRKEEVIRAVAAGWADTQKDKLKKLAEGVEYTTRREFAETLMSLRESYFPKAAKPKSEEPLTEATISRPTKSDMDVYASTLSKFKKN